MDVEFAIEKKNVEIVVDKAITIERKDVIVSVVAGETMGGHKVVYIDSGVAYLADSNDLTILNKPIGVTKGAATAGSSVDVIFSGVLNGWGSLNPGIYYVGTNGDIVSTQSGSVYIEIGRAISETEMLIDVKLIVRR